MTFGEQPYGDRSNQEVLKVVEEGYRLSAPRNCPVPLSNLMQECWSHNKTERPTFGEILSQLQTIQTNPSSLEQPTDFNTRETLRLPSCSGSEGIPYRSVAEWLEALRMRRYIDNFASEGLDTMESILELSADDLRAMGIALPGHQKRILCSIQGFKE
ncbi:ephrin type-A receptor 1-like [Mustelus asterias]